MTDTQSYIFYIISFLISAINIYIAEKSEKKSTKILFTIIGCGIPFLISALRWKVGTDYNSYMRGYNYYLWNSYKGKELFYYWVIKIAGRLGDAQYMFAIYSFLTVFFVYKALKYNEQKYPLAITFILYLFLYFGTSFNIMRQSLAVAIVFYSYKYMFQKKFLKFFIWIVIASMFHTTALLFLVIYFIIPREEKKQGKLRLMQIITIVLAIVVVSNYKLVMSKLTSFELFEKYERFTIERESRNLSTVQDVILLIIFLSFKKHLVNYDKKNNIYIFLFAIGVILDFTGYISPYIKRIASYFTISQIYILASFTKIFVDKEKKIITSLIVGYAFTIFTISTYILNQSSLLPYNMIFFK